MTTFFKTFYRALLLGLTICWAQVSMAQIPPGYYDAAAGLTGEPLRTALSGIIDGHTELQYNNLWINFFSTDNNAGKVWDMYSDNPSGTPAYQFTFGSDQCGNYSGEGDCYNREHSIPQSWFNSSTPMHSDLFHIYPVDGHVNGQRGSWPFGETNSPSTTTTNGSKVGPSSWPGYSGTVFEPIDEYKGDFARTYFYFMTRYKFYVSGWTSDMFSGDNLSPWAEDMLVAWDAADPVSTKEINRNNTVYGVQGNRNPFIDMPSWVGAIWGPTADIEDFEFQPIKLIVGDESLAVNNILSERLDIQIFDILGNLISSTQIQSGNNTIDLPASQGVYILNASSNGKHYSQKFVR